MDHKTTRRPAGQLLAPRVTAEFPLQWLRRYFAVDPKRTFLKAYVGYQSINPPPLTNRLVDRVDEFNCANVTLPVGHDR
jgi:hypothetical protein